MTEQEQYELLIEQFIEREKLSVTIIEEEAKVNSLVAVSIYEEWEKYHDEIFWHNAIYEISFMDEVPTPVRIMKEFDISLYFATKIFDYYIELVNDK